MEPQDEAAPAQRWPHDDSPETPDDREPPIWEPYGDGSYGDESDDDESDDDEPLDDTRPYQQADFPQDDERAPSDEHTVQPHPVAADQPQQPESVIPAGSHSQDGDGSEPQAAQHDAEQHETEQHDAEQHEAQQEARQSDQPPHEGPQHDEPQHEQPPHQQPQYEDDDEEPQYDKPRYEQAQYEEQPYEQPHYDGPRYEEPSLYGPPRYEQAQYGPPRYDAPQYEERQYEEPRYERAQYEERPYEDQPYEERSYEERPYEQAQYGPPHYDGQAYGEPSQYGPPRYEQAQYGPAEYPHVIDHADPSYPAANRRAHIFDVTVETRATAWSSPAVSFPRRATAPETVPAEPAAPEPAPRPTPRPEDLLVPDRPAIEKAPAQWGWRGQLNKLSAGVIKPKPTDEELADRRSTMDIQRGFSRPMTVVVIQPKGGGGKTPTTISLAAALGVHRGGYVIGWDDNETRGTLAVRIGNRDSQRTTVFDLLGALPSFERADARIGDLSHYVRSQEAQFDALVSDDHPGNMAQIGQTEFQRIHAVLQRFYRIVVIDTGNNVRSPNWQAAVSAADVVVVVSTYQRDVGYSGSWVLDHLLQTGREELATHAVTVLTAADPTTDRKVRAELLQHFGERTQQVVEIPYDPHLATGGPIHWTQMDVATRRAWTRAGAVVVNALAARDRRHG